MSAASWQEFYQAGWQFPWAAMVVPLAFALYRAIAREPRGHGLEVSLAPFVSRWTSLFLLASLLDPLATGPLAAELGPGPASEATSLAFVMLGDFRVYWLALCFASPSQTGPRAAAQAAALSALAPVLAGVVRASALPGQATWLAHELVTLAVVFVLARFAPPSEPGRASSAAFVRSALGFVAAYYGLWAAADALILAGVDAGWLLRCVPNQLYYGLFVPFVWWRFFGAGPAAPGRA